MLKKNTGRVQIGTIVYLCRTHGIDTEAVRKRLIESNKNIATAQQRNIVTLSENNDTEIDTVEVTCDTDPETPLPTFGKLRLPYPLNLIYERGQTPPQCDAMLLTALTVMGAAMDWHVRMKYSDFFQYPCLQLFVMAPSASGKGAMARVRQLADPLHEARLRKLPEAEAAYDAAMIKYHAKIKDLNEDEKAPTKPRRPVRELFLIPGNNTGTGILQNIIDSGGNGLIFEAEADTVSTSITGDYGHWSDTLRKAFDHERLSYNRRTDQEYRDLRNIRMGEVLSGTPQQLAPLIPSAENGLFSRHIFYYMPHGKKWLSQFDRGQKRTDDSSFFDALAIRFMNILEKIQAKGIIELRLSEDQMDDFDKHFSSYFEEGQLTLNGELDSTVIRQAINAVRIMSIVAVLREFEKHDGEGLTKAFVMGRDPDGQDCNLYYLSISDDDFLEVLSIFECLYYHAIHVLSFLQSTETEHRVLTEPMIVLKEMPDEFTRKQWMDECEKHRINPGYANSSLEKFKKKGAVIAGDERGKYIKAVQDMKKIPRGRKVDKDVNECKDEK